MFLPSSSGNVTTVSLGLGGGAICAHCCQKTSKLRVTFAKIFICMQNSTLEEEAQQESESVQPSAEEQSKSSTVKGGRDANRRPRTWLLLLPRKRRRVHHHRPRELP